MEPDPVSPPGGRAIVVGGGPGGAMAAEVLAAAGATVTLVERRASIGRTLLLAGRSGLNLTNDEPTTELLTRYGTAGTRLRAALDSFGPQELRAWAAGLGQETFVGSSGRVFPTVMRATPLVRAWVQRLDALGVEIRTRTRWLGFAERTDPAVPRIVLEDATGTRSEVAADVVVLALGGASWPLVGGDGSWVDALRDAGVQVHALRPANCGVELEWRPEFAERHAGTPLKNVRVWVDGIDEVAGHRSVRGDVTITAAGLEGGPIYAITAAVRDRIDRDGHAVVRVDLHPDLTTDQVAARLDRRRPKDSTSTALRRTLGFSTATVAWLREVVDAPLPTAADELAALVTAVPVRVERTASIERAISSAGGVDLDEVNDAFEIVRLPGVYAVGEMLDWEAPTGGYLLQATFSTAVAAARAAAERLDRPTA